MILKTSYRMKPPVSARLISGHPLADKLIASYLMQESSGLKVFDISGRRHHATLTGDATRTIGKFGRAVDLGGTDGHIVIPDHDDFTPVGTPLSVSFDIYMRDATDYMIVSKGVYNTNGEWRLQVKSNDKLTWEFWDESVQNCGIGRAYGVAITDLEDQWIHIVATADGLGTSSGFKLYIDAERVDDINWETAAASFDAVQNLGAPVYIGQYDGVYADGVICNAVFWRRVLTQSDIHELSIDRFCMFERRQKVLVSVPE